VGIGIAAVSVVVMPLLVWAKPRTGRELGSATVVADSTQKLPCTWLSLVVLLGLLHRRRSHPERAGPVMAVSRLTPGGNQ
jgi:divalent metal cation (Fe/Co/Zn/Cd) transporter